MGRIHTLRHAQNHLDGLRRDGHEQPLPDNRAAVDATSASSYAPSSTVLEHQVFDASRPAGVRFVVDEHPALMVDRQKPNKAARDKALLLLGFAGAFRRSELVSIQCQHLTAHDGGIEVLLPRSKTDQSGAGRTVFIPHANGDRCPVLALHEWLTISNIESGYVFRAVDRHDRVANAPLTAQSVALIVKNAIGKVAVLRKKFPVIQCAPATARKLRSPACSHSRSPMLSLASRESIPKNEDDTRTRIGSYWGFQEKAEF